MSEQEHYAVRCDKHNLKPYEYCELCYIRTYLQTAIEQNRKMVESTCGQIFLSINVLSDMFSKLEKKVDYLESGIRSLLQTTSEL